MQFACRTVLSMAKSVQRSNRPTYTVHKLDVGKWIQTLTHSYTFMRLWSLNDFKYYYSPSFSLRT